MSSNKKQFDWGELWKCEYDRMHRLDGPAYVEYNRRLGEYGRRLEWRGWYVNGVFIEVY